MSKGLPDAAHCLPRPPGGATLLGMRTIRVSAAIIFQDGYIYATRRAYGEFRGWWEFPGGKREEGETGEAAIVREIREELGVDIAIESYLATVEYQYPAFHLVMDCYICSIKSGHLRLRVHDDARWLHMDELSSVDWLPADVLVVKELMAQSGSASSVR